MKRKIALLLAAGFIAASFSTLHAKAGVSGISQFTGMSDEASKRRKRVKGGSGCDSAHDIAEHPECR